MSYIAVETHLKCFSSSIICNRVFCPLIRGICPFTYVPPTESLTDIAEGNWKKCAENISVLKKYKDTLVLRERQVGGTESGCEVCYVLVNQRNHIQAGLPGYHVVSNSKLWQST